jgi:UDP-N-acetylmuramoylalanine--D-glutamate ligase
LDWIVVEVSSFQLEKVSEFHPKVAVLLNVQPDHLDRHGSMEKYRELKSRMFCRMTAGDVGIVNYGEMDSVRSLVSGENDWVSFGGNEASDIYYNAACGRVSGGGRYDAAEVDIGGSSFDNAIMGQTAAAAVAVAQVCGIDLSVVSRSVKEFAGLNHRMEQVLVIKGVKFIDDSKATNLAALKAGLEMTRAPVRLIAGGQLKEKSVEFVKEVLANRAVCVYVIGDAANAFEAAWGEYVKCNICADLETAVRMAWEDADCGDTVLLSPGCASFDQFRSYKDRGEQFKRIVERINEEDKHENIVCD